MWGKHSKASFIITKMITKYYGVKNSLYVKYWATCRVHEVTALNIFLRQDDL